MLFNSYAFIFVFLPLALIGYFALAKLNPKYPIVFLALASIGFYGYWDVRYVPLLLGSILFNYWQGGLISGASNATARKRLLLFAVGINLIGLVYFKYSNLFVETLNALAKLGIPGPNVILPLGVSFFTFTQIAYLVDCHKGLVRERSLTNYALFVTFFPHLIAGPVLHHKDMMPQFNRAWNLSPRWSNFSAGITIFAIGLAKKVLIGDSLAPFSAELFDSKETPTLLFSWVYAFSYAMQLYFDFSGYSDMAIGLARLFGIRMPLNFASPYKARDISDFWRRWHISLSVFLRDYLYIALGGNRHGSTRRYFNLFMTMFLGGLWHGAAWSFALWGALHGFYLILFHGWSALRKKIGLPALPNVVAWGLTFLAVVIAWVYFRSPSLGRANEILAAMFGANGLAIPKSLLVRLGPLQSLLSSMGAVEYQGGGKLLLQAIAMTTGAAMLAFFFPNTQELCAKFRPPMKAVNTKQLTGTWAGVLMLRPSLKTALYVGALLGVCLLTLASPSEFLYFQF
jgi:alginate O-acetyltransferase complex protein AlgI